MSRDINDAQVEKLQLTVEQKEVIQELFGIDMPFQVTVVKKTGGDEGNKLLITDELDEQEALDATCAAWC